MDFFTVSLFGHREINDLMMLERRLAPIVNELMRKRPYVSFLIGRNGEFDEYAASVIKRIRRESGRDNSEITLVLPYAVANVEYYESYYDSIIIPEVTHRVHPKSAITLRNRWMIERSDLIITYVERGGGADRAMKYAERLHKRIINLCDSDPSDAPF